MPTPLASFYANASLEWSRPDPVSLELFRHSEQIIFQSGLQIVSRDGTLVTVTEPLPSDPAMRFEIEAEISRNRAKGTLLKFVSLKLLNRDVDCGLLLNRDKIFSYELERNDPYIELFFGAIDAVFERRQTMSGQLFTPN